MDIYIAAVRVFFSARSAGYARLGVDSFFRKDEISSVFALSCPNRSELGITYIFIHGHGLFLSFDDEYKNDTQA